MENKPVKINKFLLVTLPFLIWVAIMLTLTSIPGDKIPEVSIWNWDKLAHCFVYIIFSFLLFRYLFYRRKLMINSVILASIIISILYAGFDELHQILIPNRTCAWQDFFADIIGVCAGTFIAWKYFKRKLTYEKSSH